MQMDIARKSPLALFVPKVMNHFGDYKIIVDKMDRVRSELSGISIYKVNAEGSPTRILAPEGTIRTVKDGDITLELRNGAVHQPDPEKNNQYTITKFNKFVLRVPSGEEDMAAYIPTPREMTFSELLEKAGDAKKEGQSPAPLMTEIHQRIAVSFASAVFVILGIVLGIQLKKGSKAVGVGMSMVVILVYYGLLLLMVSLASRNSAASAVLPWVPNLAALLVSGFLWMRLVRR
jgi:lipopolysaccharide export system permease protein